MKLNLIIVLSAPSHIPCVVALPASSGIDPIFSDLYDYSRLVDTHNLALFTPQNSTDYAGLGSQMNLTNLSSPGEKPKVEHCNLAGQLGEVERTVFLTQAAANLVKFDIPRGVDSLFGFRAMFKTNTVVYPVALYLENIYQYARLRGLNPSPRNNNPPHFACVAQDTMVYYTHLELPYDPWERCQRPRRDGRPHQAFYADGTAYIFLCPSFFRQPVMPPPSRGISACPTISQNRFLGDADSFYKGFQLYTLLYTLIRFYLGTSGLSQASSPREVFDWNLCVHYTPIDSVLNPTNLLLYIAMVQQRCTAAPDPNAPPFGSHYSSQQIAPASPAVPEQNLEANLIGSTASMALASAVTPGIATA